jgi:predicted lipoprotein with Yx(FWY)xxD motif
MPIRRTIAIAFAAAGLMVGACTSAATPAPTAAPPSQAPASQAPASQAPASQAAASVAGPVTINSASSTLGTILTGANGLTLYVHAGDTATSSTCTGGCATAWPPLTVPAGSQAVAGTGVTGTIGTLMRADGTTQVTYAGMPLYYWMSDKAAGDTTGQNVNGFTVALAAGTGAGGAASPSASGKPGY